MSGLLNKSEVVIGKEVDGWMFTDIDGNFIYKFPLNFTRDQIMDSIDFMNMYFSKGVAIGKSIKEREIQTALGLG